MTRTHLALVAAAAAVTAAAIPADPPPARRDYRGLMREFVQNISATVKKARPEFLVVAQGGVELLTADGEPDGKPVADYLKAIDGFAQEEVFYGYDNKDDRKSPADETEQFVGLLGVARKAGKPVLSIDYATTRANVDDAYARNAAAGFVPFVADHRGLDNIPAYPPKPPGENAGDVKSLADVKNFLYVIDGEPFGDQAKYLAALGATNHDLVVLDPFIDDATVTPADVDRLKKKANGGRRLVLCYVSIGEAEDYRHYWQDNWRPGRPAFLGPEDPDWKGNFAVKYWDRSWQAIIAGRPRSYLARVVAAGFDGVYLDRVDEYEWFEEHGE
jgi:cysteinyl-tRNA synthetase, unknown class